MVTKQMIKAAILMLAVSMSFYAASAGGGHKQHQASPKAAQECQSNRVLCAKTVTVAFAPNGDLWRLWAYQQKIYYQISRDAGKRFGEVQTVGIAPEKISARNENRPKIGFDSQQGVYLSWASPLGKRFTSNIRFTYSADYGKQFVDPVTVNDDGLITGHSFNEMLVEPNGDVSLVWLDSRLRYLAEQKGQEVNGSALYLGKANPRQNKGFEFSNEMLANNTCVCCRIAMDVNKNGNLAVFWRHIFGDNIRDFALMTLNEDKQLTRISHDLWKIDGCPHQGGGISIDHNNRYHLVWFNQGTAGKGIFYGYSDDQGKSLSAPLKIGEHGANAAHPHVIVNKQEVHLVWTEFNGTEFLLRYQRSLDNGASFSKARTLTSSVGQSDRPFLHAFDDKVYVSWQRPQLGHWFEAL